MHQIQGLTESGKNVPVLVEDDGRIIISNGSAGEDREIVVTGYQCKTAFTGASVGDTITLKEIVNVSATPPTTVSLWRNQTTGTDLLAAPDLLKLEVSASQKIVSAQRTPSWLRATADGSVSAGAYSISFTAISGTITVAGAALNVGESVSFSAPLGDTLGSISYTVSSGELVIAKVS